MKKLTEKDVLFSITPEEEDTTPRQGGFQKEDGSPDDELIATIEADREWNEWAWCTVRVRAAWQGFTGDAYLGQCCYKDREDFERGGYLPQMRAEALEELNTKVAQVAKALKEVGFV